MALAYYVNNENQLGMVRQALANNNRFHFVVILDDLIVDPVQSQQLAAQNMIIASALLPDLNSLEFLQSGDRYHFEICYKNFLLGSEMAPTIDELITIVGAKMCFEDIDFIFYQKDGDRIVSSLDPRAFTNVLFDFMRDFHGINVCTFPQPPQANSINPAYIGQIQNKAYMYGIYNPPQQQAQQEMLFKPMWEGQ